MRYENISEGGTNTQTDHYMIDGGGGGGENNMRVEDCTIVRRHCKIHNSNEVMCKK